MLTQIIYISFAAKDFDDRELLEIMEVSARNNEKAGLSGLLLYANGTFMQALEGKAAVVNECMNRIHTDPRHHSLNVLVSSEIPTREFKQWYMGFRRLSPDDAQALPSFAPFFEKGFNPVAISRLPDGGLALMQALGNHAIGNTASFG